MPKLIDYPRTSYTGAWEVAETVDDTGGKCALETCARKLNRKVSGSFKAIVGSAVKFGLLTSKRELLTTTTLFRRIKHAYDKQEELLFHREAFLTPPLFTQLCRKFRSRELPIAMLDVLLIREFEVEEINAQGVAKAFVDGARMTGLLNEQDIVADIDQLSSQQPPRRELSNQPMGGNIFRQDAPQHGEEAENEEQLPTARAADTTGTATPGKTGDRNTAGIPLPASRPAPQGTGDAIASLFGLGTTTSAAALSAPPATPTSPTQTPAAASSTTPASVIPATEPAAATAGDSPPLFKLQLHGPGINTSLDVLDAEDLQLVRVLLDKIERQLSRSR